jgi:hypothetical protein
MLVLMGARGRCTFDSCLSIRLTDSSKMLLKDDSPLHAFRNIIVFFLILWYRLRANQGYDLNIDNLMADPIQQSYIPTFSTMFQIDEFKYLRV